MVTDKQSRKERPIARGFLDYFPDAAAAVANVSFVANEQHNPGEQLHWAKEKSSDHADALVRHLIERGGIDTDGLRHTAKVAWRAMALLQTEIDQWREWEQDVASEAFDEPTFRQVPLEEVPTIDPETVYHGVDPKFVPSQEAWEDLKERAEVIKATPSAGEWQEANDLDFTTKPVPVKCPFWKRVWNAIKRELAT